MKSKDIGVGCLLSDMIKSGFVSGEVVSPVDLVTLEWKFAIGVVYKQARDLLSPLFPFNLKF